MRKTPLLAGLLLALTLGNVVAGEAQAPYVKKINAPIPNAEIKGAEIQTTLNATMGTMTTNVKQGQATGAPAATGSSSGLPMVPASDATNTASVPVAEVPSSAPAVQPPAVGPARAYATLAEAAKDGVDPFASTRPASAAVAELPPVESEVQLDLKDYHTWWPWLRANVRDLLPYLLILVGGLVMGAFVSRRGARR